MTPGNSNGHQKPDPLITKDILSAAARAVDGREGLVSALRRMRDLEPHLVVALEDRLLRSVACAATHARGISKRMLEAFRTEQVEQACFIFIAMQKAWSADLPMVD